MILRYFFFWGMLCTTGCNSDKFLKSANSNEKDTIRYQANFLFKDTSGTVFFECEKFVDQALDKYTLNFIKKECLGFLNFSREAVINKHDADIVDTIYTFSNQGNKIQIYRAKQDDFIFTFDVSDPRLSLQDKVKAGMTKLEFSQMFHISDNFKVAHISNKEGSMRFMFVFEENSLKKIYSYLYLD